MIMFPDIELEEMKKSTKMKATEFLNELMIRYNFDVFVSVDNSMAGIAAAAHFPALSVPMGYRKNGEPSNITFITSSSNEQLLYNVAYLFEKNLRREAPKIIINFNETKKLTMKNIYTIIINLHDFTIM